MQKNFKDGVHNITNDEYHGSDGVSRSGLWLLKKAPAYYYHRYINPYYEDHKVNKNLIMGNLVHCLTLEPELFDKEYIIKPELPELPKAGLLKDLGRDEFNKQKHDRAQVVQSNKILTDTFNIAAQDRQVIERSVYSEAIKIASAVLEDELAQSLLDGAKIEQSIYWTHQPTGIQCKARPDAWLGTIAIDLKTTVDASREAFKNSAYRYGYFLQAGMISEALRSVGVTMEKFIVLAVEKVEPYVTGNFDMDEDAIEYGIDLFNQLMQKFKECQDDGRWPAYELQTLSLPYRANFEEL